MVNHKISVMDSEHNVLTPEEYNQKHGSLTELLGIVVQTDILGLVLSPVQWNGINWSNKDDNDEIVLTEEQCESVALQTISGLEHTREIVQKQEGDNGESAAQICWNYKNGGLQWYLPSLLELSTIYVFKDEINNVIQQIDKDIVLLPNNDYMWSSSEGIQWNAWNVNFGDGHIYYRSIKCNGGTVRAVAAFSSLSSIGERVDILANKEDCKSNVVGMTDEQLVQILRERGFTGAINKLINL
jgi:hypothetical protein